jgi:plasmid stability protein
MRTTLNLDDDIMRALKRRAAETGQTMTSLVEEALRELLRRSPREARPFRLKFVTVRGPALPGVDVTNRDSLYERMEGRE